MSVINKIARDISILSTMNEVTLDTKNARSAESEEYLNKKAIIMKHLIMLSVFHYKLEKHLLLSMIVQDFTPRESL